VFIGYYHSNMTNTHYLGVDFAIHSCLVIALTWLVPYFVIKKSQPSLQKSALKGLHKGLTQALSQIDHDLQDSIKTLAEEHQGQLKQVETLIEQCDNGKQEPRLSIETNTSLSRMLVG
jgi:hypothetical protein